MVSVYWHVMVNVICAVMRCGTNGTIVGKRSTKKSGKAIGAAGVNVLARQGWRTGQDSRLIGKRVSTHAWTTIQKLKHVRMRWMQDWLNAMLKKMLVMPSASKLVRVSP